MANSNILLFSIIISYYMCGAYKILVVFPFPATSHYNLGNGYIRHLLKAGHEVTYITPLPLQNPHKNLRQVDVSSNRKVFPENTINIHALMQKEVDFTSELTNFLFLVKVAESTVEHENVRSLLEDPSQQFDLVIAEWMFNELYSGFAAVFNCPYIWAFPYEPHANILSLIDEPTNPAYVPQLGSNNVPPFTFIQRVQELFNQIYSLGLKTFYFPTYEREIYNRAFSSILAKKGGGTPISYDQMRYKASFMLGGTHVSYGQSIRLPQNFRLIGGYHIEEAVETLPEDLQKLMDIAKDGVIYFSMGSNLKSRDLAVEIKRDLLKMFSGLKQTVLWKFEEKLDGLPNNVHILKWAPQQSILAHPNCILFITHGGLLSLTETVHFGIPLIGIPIYTDQFNNVDRAVYKGFGKRVDISYSLADDLRVAIKDMVDNRGYAEKAREVSLAYHDRVVSPGTELVHWVEHVVRTRGAPHLRSPALHVPWYQKMYLDLLALLLAVIFVVKYVFTRRFCSRKLSVQKKND